VRGLLGRVLFLYDYQNDYSLKKLEKGQKMKKALLICTLALSAMIATAGTKPSVAKKLDLSMYPVAKEGFKQVVFSVPAKANENDFKIEVFVGADRVVDCNPLFMLGTIQAQTVEGYGFDFYNAETTGEIAGTLMACPLNKTHTAFVHVQPQLIAYNSRLPVVFYVPKNMNVKYRIWRADAKMSLVPNVVK
jgi:ecotin